MNTSSGSVMRSRPGFTWRSTLPKRVASSSSARLKPKATSGGLGTVGAEHCGELHQRGEIVAIVGGGAEDAAGLEDAMHFGDGPLLIAHVVQHVHGDDAIEARVRGRAA